MVFCCAINCYNRPSPELRRTKGITFHSFPDEAKDGERRKRWIANLRRHNFVVTKNTKICSQHFLQEMFDRTGQITRLKPHAVPTLFEFDVPSHQQKKKILIRPDNSHDKGTSASPDHHQGAESPSVTRIRMEHQYLPSTRASPRKQKQRVDAVELLKEGILVGKEGVSGKSKPKDYGGKSKPKDYGAMCTVCGNRLEISGMLPDSRKACALICCVACQQFVSMSFAFLQGLVLGKSLCTLLGHQSFIHDCHRDIDGGIDDTVRKQHERDMIRDDTEEDTYHTPVHFSENSNDGAQSTYHLVDVNILSASGDKVSSAERMGVGCRNDLSKENKRGPLALNQRKIHREQNTKKEKRQRAKREGNYTSNKRLLAGDEKNCEHTEQHMDKKMCSECGAFFKNNRGLHHHIAMKHRGISAEVKRQSNLSCNKCGKTYSSYKAHCRKWHPDRSAVSCRLCSKPFKSWTGRTLHMRIVHKVDKPQECEVCGETFSCHRDYQRHKAHHHTQNSVCHICGKRFKFKNALKLHLDAHAGIKRHFCEVCGKGFVRITTLCSHRAVVHPTNKEKYFQCDKCPESFSTKWVLNKHLLSKHACGTLLKSIEKNCLPVLENSDCQTCKETAAGSSSCPAHSRQVNFVCKVCSISYSSVVQYLQHMKQNHEDKIFQCQNCGKTFSSLQYLKAHMKQHQEPRFACDICGKKFTYKCNLNAHHSSHYSEKPFHCSVCMKSFRLKFLLKCHMRCHDQELQYVCPVCGKGFTRQQNVKRHIQQMHSGSSTR